MSDTHEVLAVFDETDTVATASGMEVVGDCDEIDKSSDETTETRSRTSSHCEYPPHCSDSPTLKLAGSSFWKDAAGRTGGPNHYQFGDAARALVRRAFANADEATWAARAGRAGREGGDDYKFGDLIRTLLHHPGNVLKVAIAPALGGGAVGACAGLAASAPVGLVVGLANPACGSAILAASTFGGAAIGATGLTTGTVIASSLLAKTAPSDTCIVTEQQPVQLESTTPRVDTWDQILYMTSIVAASWSGKSLQRSEREHVTFCITSLAFLRCAMLFSLDNLPPDECLPLFESVSELSTTVRAAHLASMELAMDSFSALGDCSAWQIVGDEIDDMACKLVSIARTCTEKCMQMPDLRAAVDHVIDEAVLFEQ